MEVGDIVDVVKFTSVIVRCPECGTLMSPDVENGHLKCMNAEYCDLHETVYEMAETNTAQIRVVAKGGDCGGLD